jgi:CRP-like cAMP-binding protein
MLQSRALDFVPEWRDPAASVKQPASRQRPFPPLAQAEVPDVLTASQLSQRLGGPHALMADGVTELKDGVVAVHLSLRPGDMLYTQGSHSHYAYILESGVMQCSRAQDNGTPVWGTMRYAGTGDWIGLYDRPARRPESTCAVTHASLLALPVNDLRDMAASSSIMAELIARSSSMALKRDWRVAYRLRDLPSYTRAVMGLVYLMHLADPTGSRTDGASTMTVQLDSALFGQWLGLLSDDLTQCLTKLQRYGALKTQNGSIVALMPHVLNSATSTVVLPFD